MYHAMGAKDIFFLLKLHTTGCHATIGREHTEEAHASCKPRALPSAHAYQSSRPLQYVRVDDVLGDRGTPIRVPPSSRSSQGDGVACDIDMF